MGIEKSHSLVEAVSLFISFWLSRRFLESSFYVVRQRQNGYLLNGSKAGLSIKLNNLGTKDVIEHCFRDEICKK